MRQGVYDFGKKKRGKVKLKKENCGEILKSIKRTFKKKF